MGYKSELYTEIYLVLFKCQNSNEKSMGPEYFKLANIPMFIGDKQVSLLCLCGLEW